jgi:SAM-dependent methyltransferase
MPLADGLVSPGSDPDSERVYPLTFVRCTACTLVQILETVDPQTLFGEEYPYYSSYSETLVEHSRRNAEELIDRLSLDDRTLVVELASNDGYLLQWFAKAGIPVLGIDPAPGPAGVAEERGIPTICEFFDPELAERLAGMGRQAEVIIGNNVLAHVPDQNRLVDAIGRLLGPDGVVVMEFPYVRDLIDDGEFDTIYHEHHCYFSVTSVKRLFARHGLELFRVEHHPIHGGSLRVFFSRNGRVESVVGEYLREEERVGLNDGAYYRDFAVRVASIRDGLNSLLHSLKAEGAKIGAYAAAAKGAVMLNYCGIGSEVLDYVVDRNVHKQGWLMPGVHVPIVEPARLASDPPDHLLILAWNFKDEIMAQQQAFVAGGGRFIVPVPEPTIL